MIIYSKTLAKMTKLTETLRVKDISKTKNSTRIKPTKPQYPNPNPNVLLTNTTTITITATTTTTTTLANTDVF